MNVLNQLPEYVRLEFFDNQCLVLVILWLMLEKWIDLPSFCQKSLNSLIILSMNQFEWYCCPRKQLTNCWFCGVDPCKRGSELRLINAFNLFSVLTGSFFFVASATECVCHNCLWNTLQIDWNMKSKCRCNIKERAITTNRNSIIVRL